MKTPHGSDLDCQQSRHEAHLYYGGGGGILSLLVWIGAAGAPATSLDGLPFVLSPGHTISHPGADPMDVLGSASAHAGSAQTRPG